MPGAPSTMPVVRPEITALTPWLTDLRRQLHRCPELAYQEERTASLARTVLASAGLVVRDGLARTGLAAMWETGRPGPTVAFRADMGGLNITEPEGLFFVSEHLGFMHACGHDFHLALLLGLARLAAGGGLKARGGRLMFIAQPAEEGGGGAAAMLADGLFETVARPDCIFAGHADPSHPPGQLAVVDAEPVMAGVLDFEITVSGRGGHAGDPRSAENPHPWVARLVTALDEFTPPAGGLITVTMVHGGERTNVIPEEASCAGTARWRSPAARAAIEGFVEKLCLDMAGEGRVRVRPRWHEGYPPTINDPRLAGVVRAVAADWLGSWALGSAPSSFGGEDFSYFLEKVPGVFILLGTGGPGCDAPLHSPRFRLNEEALPVWLELWARLAERMLESPGA